MCVKKHIHFALSPVEQLKYWFVGVPIVLLIAYTLSTIVYDFRGIVNVAQTTQCCNELLEVKK